MALELPGYQFIEKIGEGGMATVYRGVQQSLKRSVAIKVLNAQLRQHDEVRRAFEVESLIIARLSHPNIVPVVDRGVSERGTPFFIMEFIKGRDLAAILRRGRLKPNRVMELALQIARALAYAHRNGIVHRDVKPGNVLVDRDWNVRVVDFGIAQLMHDAFMAVSEDKGEATQSWIMGTEAYMAPEVVRAPEQVSFQSDIYSLGVILFEMLAGRLPDGSPTPPSRFNPEVSADLDRLVLKCLAPDPEMRMPNAEQVCDGLLDILRGQHLDESQVKRAPQALVKKSFALLDVIREGAESAVYLFAEQNTHKRYVVKKSNKLHEGIALGRRLAAMECDHWVKVYGVSSNKRSAIVVMDYMPGGSLEERMVRAFSLDEFLHIATQVASGLIHAHKHQIIHGHLCADNVLFDESSNARLADFGWPAPKPVTDFSRESDSPRFPMPDEPQDERLDIYACGVLFYRMLIAEVPRYHRGKLTCGRAFKQLPEALRSLLMSMLNLQPAKRPSSMKAVLQVLDEFRNDHPTQLWVPESPSSPDAGVGKQNKEMLLFLLLVLLFLVLANTGVIAIFQGWGLPFLEPLFRWLL